MSDYDFDFEEIEEEFHDKSIDMQKSKKSPEKKQVSDSMKISESFGKPKVSGEENNKEPKKQDSLTDYSLKSSSAMPELQSIVIPSRKPQQHQQIVKSNFAAKPT